MRKQTWTHISDVLPKEKSFVLVACISPQGEYVRIPVTGYHHGDGKFSTVNWFVVDAAFGITHWMPLPNSVKVAKGQS